MSAELPDGRVAIVGAGRMGVGIAEALLRGGTDREIALADQTPELARRGLARLITRMRSHADAGLIGADEAERVAGVRATEDVAGATAGAALVIEVVTEDLAVKQQVLRACSSSAPASAIIATNTSSLSIDVLARSCKRPQCFLGTHWFNPPEWTPGVEVVAGAMTARNVVEAVVALLQSVGKHPIIVADSVGFVANRLQMALFCEAARCVDEGLATVEGLDEIVRSSFGFRLPFYGPFQIADMAGLETYAVVARQHEQAFGDRFNVSANLRALVERGHYGTRAGAGFYQYEAGAAEQMLRERDRYYAALEQLLQRLDSQSRVDEGRQPDAGTTERSPREREPGSRP